MSKDTGGPAFPSECRTVKDEIEGGLMYRGMTLRDYFAAKWLQGHVSNHKTRDLSPSEAAKVAYWAADAFLKERSK